MTLFGAITYAAAVVFWLITAWYALLASRQLIVEQFLTPGLFAPLALFANYWPLFAIAILLPWVSARPLLRRHHELMFTAPLTLWVVAAVAAIVPGVIGMVVGPVASWIAIGSIAMIWLLATMEHPIPRGAAKISSGRTSADFFACLLAAVCMVIVEAALNIARTGGAVDIGQTLVASARTQVFTAMIAFLVLTAGRAIGARFPRQAGAEARMAVVALGALIGRFLDHVAFASLSLDGATISAAAYLSGYAIAVAITAPAMIAFADRADGIRSVARALAPRWAGQWLGFAGWVLVVSVVAWGFDYASRLSDASFVLSRFGVTLVWLCLLGGAIGVVRTAANGSAALFLGLAAIALAAHAVIDRWGR